MPLPVAVAIQSMASLTMALLPFRYRRWMRVAPYRFFTPAVQAEFVNRVPDLLLQSSFSEPDYSDC